MNTPTIESTAPQLADYAWRGAIVSGGVTCYMGTTADIAPGVVMLQNPNNAFLGLDTETGSAPTAGRWAIRCVTIATGDTAVVFDVRDPEQRRMVWELTANPAKEYAIHNAPYDLPILYAWGLAPESLCDRVYDPLVTARLMPQLAKRDLSSLAERYLGANDVDLAVAITAAGAGKDSWYDAGDIDRTVYAASAARDAAVVAQVAFPVHQEAVTFLQSPSLRGKATSDTEANDIILTVHQAARACLHMMINGLPIDHDAVAAYRETTRAELADAKALLESFTIERKGETVPVRAGNAADLVAWLNSQNHLPADWPRTKGGSLSGDRKSLQKLAHLPAVAAHLTYTETTKVLNDYLEKFEDLAHPATGKLYPQVGTLAATSTGRQSASNPPIQQIPGTARPMISTGGERWVSIDWTSVEPMIAAYAAGETWITDSVLGGGDLYIPIARRAGLIPADVEDVAAHDHPGRKKAKIVLLMLLYGGGVSTLASSLDVPEPEAKQLRAAVLGAMPRVAQWTNHLKSMAEQSGAIITAGGRVLPVAPDKSFRAVNYFHQGTAADLLLGVLAECQRRGIAHGLRLTVHDEIVCTAEVADEVEDIMRHHSPCMNRFIGRAVEFPTDRHALDTHWAAV